MSKFLAGMLAYLGVCTAVHFAMAAAPDARSASTSTAKPEGAATDAAAATDGARLDTYLKPDGKSYFAVSLAPTVSLPATDGEEIVVLFDTSASQVGVHRDRALKSLQAFAAGCRPTDRLRLVAIDLKPVALTSAFVAVESQPWQEAVQKLERRAPLGATDLPLALQTTLAMFSPQSEAGHHVVYIGDGISSAHVLVPDEFAALVGKLVKAHLSVTSFAVGPRTDANTLAALATQTGGMLAIDGENMDPKEAGAFLARSVHEQVLWPTKAIWPKDFGTLYPQPMPPLRSDRDTVLIGTGKINGPVSIEVSGQVAGQEIDQHWTVTPRPSSDDFAYLAVLVDAAAKDNGISLPLVGTAGLTEAGRLVMDSAEGLATLASQAVSAGNMATAERLADEVLRRDPQDPTALAIKKQIAKSQTGDAAADPAASPENPKSGSDKTSGGKTGDAKSSTPKRAIKKDAPATRPRKPAAAAP